MKSRHAFDMELIEGFCGDLKKHIYTSVCPVKIEAWVTKEPVCFSEKNTGVCKLLKTGEPWGELWDCAWMHVTGHVPAECRGKTVVLLLDISGEGCVFDICGNPLRGITSYASMFDPTMEIPVKRVIPVSDCSDGNEIIDLWVDAGCNDLFGRLVDGGTLKQAEIAVCDENLRQLFYDYRFLKLLAETLPENSPKRRRLEAELYDLAVTAGQLTPNEINGMRQRLSVFFNEKNEDSSLQFSAVGHSHLDLAWLWPIRETKRKGVRTFSTVIETMNRYPEYLFGASQPQLYQWIRESQPALYEQIRERIREGRWECQGAMWVEPDTNVTGGESLVRQILYGKRYFKDEFGRDMQVLWLPDVFGYSGALPQIMKKSGVPYFMTIKLSWNQTNIFPYNTFRWKGIDGSEVLAHMPPENTYNSPATPGSIRKAESNYKNAGESPDVLMLFGIGDGGGGPNHNHLEYLRREKNIAGLPKVRQEFAIDFFNRLDQNRGRYPVWQGELYLERHQGTYTTQSDCKKYNRRIENALRDCEFLCSVANRVAGFEYPADTLETIWKEVLLYQFHDILPGSSIDRVYREAYARYRILLEQVRSITDQAMAALAGALEVSEGQTLVFNTLPWERTEFIQADDTVCRVELPPCGYTVIDRPEAKALPSADPIRDTALENNLIRVIFDRDGTLKSIYDKTTERELLNPGAPFNNLAVYEDKGDCWDIPVNYRDRPPEIPAVTGFEAEHTLTGQKLRFRYKYNKSAFVQSVSLPENSKKLVFEMEMDWQETFKMLRASYPLNIEAAEAACNIQFGHIMRPTHRNTSWDGAKYEIYAQKWIDLSEKGYGVAMINNGKYGFNVWDNTLDINLLRSPMFPGTDADKGSHSVSYELFIHEGDLSEVYKEAYSFNIPALTVQGRNKTGGGTYSESLIGVSKPNIIIETVKQAEDGSGTVLRMYECEGRRTAAEVYFKGSGRALLTDLLEDEQRELDVRDERFSLVFKPFEIHTVKLPFA